MASAASSASLVGVTLVFPIEQEIRNSLQRSAQKLGLEKDLKEVIDHLSKQFAGATKLATGLPYLVKYAIANLDRNIIEMSENDLIHSLESCAALGRNIFAKSN